MQAYEQMKKYMDTFNFEMLEEYRKITFKIKQESGFLGIFKKKLYGRHIEKMIALRKQIKKMKPEEIETSDPVIADIGALLAKALERFDRLLGAQINLQELLKRKSEGEKIKMSECSPWVKMVNDDTDEMNKAIRKLDVRYADFLEKFE